MRSHSTNDSAKTRVDPVREEQVRLELAKHTENIDRIMAGEGLENEATRAFVDSEFRDGIVQSAGAAITKILPPVSRSSVGDAHAVKNRTVLEKLAEFLERFLGLSRG